MSSTSFLIGVGVLLSLSHLVLGIGTGLWLRHRDARDSQRESRKAQHLLAFLRQLAGSMAEDVDTYQKQVDTASTTLENLPTQDSTEVTDLVFSVVRDMVQSNQQLKDQLTSAEIQLKQQAAEIEDCLSRSLTDALTGLPNRRALDDDLERRLAGWHRRGAPLSIILIDLDRFKSINDTYGHTAGDQVLQQAAQLLKSSFREMDLVARFGGEEFAVVLPNTVGVDAQTAVCKAIDKIRSIEFSIPGRTLQVTFSAGVATVLENETAAEFINRADKALYRSKETGRNRAHFHDGQQAILVGSAETVATTEQITPESEPDHMPDNPTAGLQLACEDLRQHVAEWLNKTPR